MKESIKRLANEIKHTHLYGKKLNKLTDEYTTDPIIQYPSYKSMDEFIDVDALKQLDSKIQSAITKYLATPSYKKNKFDTGPMTLKTWGRKTTASHIIALTKHIRTFNYFDINNPLKWKRTIYAEQFDFLMQFIDTLPFKKTARIMLIFDNKGFEVTPHRDHSMQNICHEFIWFRPNLNKKFYMYNKLTKEKQYVNSYSAWFDTVNQFHGADAGKGLDISIRVDGEFTDALRAQIPRPRVNPASTPAYWAAVSRVK